MSQFCSRINREGKKQIGFALPSGKNSSNFQSRSLEVLIYLDYGDRVKKAIKFRK